MAFLASFLFVIILATAVLLIFIPSRFCKKHKNYPPVAGTVIHQLLNFHRLLEYMTDQACNYRTYRLLGLFRNEVYTSDPANVEYILKTNFANYGKGWYHHGIMSDLLGDGIFTVDGEKWRHQRKMASYEFSTKILRDFSSVVFRENALKLARIVLQASISSQAIEIQDLFMKSTLDSVFKIVLGIKLDSMCGTYADGTRFSNAFDEACINVMYRYFNIFWKIKRLLNIGSEAALRNNIKVVDEFVFKAIETKIEQIHKSEGNLQAKKKGDILTRFLELDEADPKFLRDITLSFIIAGKDTTSITLSWFLCMLCKHPCMQEKVAREVIEAAELSHSPTPDEIVTKLTEERLDKMQYLNAALTETIRLFPAAPVAGKLCFGDDTWPDGFSVKKGDLVSYQPFVMGRMKFIWGDDAEEFRPDRWLDENGVFHQESPFKFTAFQGGPRICLGKEFAYRQMKILSAVLLGCFEFKLCDENKAVNYKISLTLQIDGGLHLLAFSRSCHGSAFAN